MLEPRVGAFFAEELRHALEELRRGDRLVAALAIENGDRHAPQPLARDAPVGTGLDHAGDAVLGPAGVPLYFADFVERAGAEAPRVILSRGDGEGPRATGLGVLRFAQDDTRIHRDEPLLGGAEDHRVLATPAVRVRVRDRLGVH